MRNLFRAEARTIMIGQNPTFVSTEEAKEAAVSEILKKLASSKESLPSSEAEKRPQQYGANEIPEKKVNPVIKFLSYF